MDNNNNNVQPAAYDWNNPAADDIQNPVMIRRKIKKGYGWAGLSMVFQLIISLVINIVLSLIYSSMVLSDFLAQNPDATYEQLTEYSQNMPLSSRFLIISTAVCYLFANIGSFLIGISALKAFKAKNILGTPKLGADSIALGAAGILGIQAASMFIQNIIMNITQLTGMDSATAQAASFSDDALLNIIIVLYFVIIAPITEELLCRGFVMNALAPVSRKFAVIASAVLFGLMHGNFNQMFNGFLLGLLLGYIAMKSGSVVSSIIAHMTANANAMICSYLYEYKIYEASGDAAYTYELIHFAVLLVIGITALIVFLKKNGHIKDEDRITDYSYETEPSQAKELTWKLLAKCPSVWIVAVIYIIVALTSVSSIAV